MPRPKRITRSLCLRVSEPRPADLSDDTPGQRFAAGWGRFVNGGRLYGDGIAECGGDPIQIAGWVAAQAAWSAHHDAVNWMEPVVKKAMPR